MSKFIDLTGRQIGMWKVLSRALPPEGKIGTWWLCECQCESKTIKSIIVGNLLTAIRDPTIGSTNYGCVRNKKNQDRLRTHGEASRAGTNTVSRTYSCWLGIKNRVLNPKSKYDIKNYGGLYIDPRWIESYIAFKTDMGECPPTLEIDRINPHKGYYKENCRWATSAMNSKNRRNRRAWLYKGAYMNASELAELSPLKLACNTIAHRLITVKGEITDDVIWKILTTLQHKGKKSSY